jgi:UDP-GlcNAc:undecaprenyl-phosphate GlcNAc-1-phosphate transferase
LLIFTSVAIGLVGSFLAPLVVRPFLQRRNVLDHPNQRSSHDRPVLRGGGLGVAAAIALGYLTYFALGAGSAADLIVVAIVLAAAVVGWIEDDRGIPTQVRALVQLVIGIAGAGALVVNLDGGIAIWVLGAIAIAAYINVANFMDGVNGISALHGVVVGVAYGVGGLSQDLPWLAVGGFLLAATFAGFLPWNLFGRGLFLGDVGSYVLGAFAAALAVGALASGLPFLFVIAPISIYLADSGFTLIRRALRGEKWYEAHRTHQYQLLTTYGATHVVVAVFVALATALAAVAGYLSLTLPSDLFWVPAAMLLIVLLGYFLVVDIARRRSRLRETPEVK